MEETTKKKIVVIDELAMVREGLVELCTSSGHYSVVGHCGDGAAALRLVEEQRPDAVVIDYNIPSLFSLELARKIQSMPYGVSVIIMSVRGERKLVLECLRAGINGFVLKSGPARNLIAALDMVVSGGVYVSPELQVERLFGNGRRVEHEDPIEALSSREYQVFSLLIDGIRAKEIAARLDLSPKTVDTYRASLMRKLDIHDVAGLVKFAIQRDLTSVC